MMMGGTWAEFGSTLAGLVFIWASIQQVLPSCLLSGIDNLLDRLQHVFYPYVKIKFDECSDRRSNRMYYSIRTYLGVKSTPKAKRLTGDMAKDVKSYVISVDRGEEFTDEFNGIKIWWSSHSTVHSPPAFPVHRSSAPEEKKYYTLTFHERNREIVTGQYLNYVMEEAKIIELSNRQRKLYTNNPSDSWYWFDRNMWTDVVFDHPATFETLAMDPDKKSEIINDLIAFTKGKEYYKKLGKPWKRGYLLHGPPGTGKSTMIAAMANFLNYDVYDLELTSVKDNMELRRLFVETTSKSIIVIEDIDCSLNLTGKRKSKAKKAKAEKAEGDEKEDSLSSDGEKEEEATSKVTLSGLLNSIDGIWSAFGPERIFVFTTNHVDKLDPALIRCGRMDMHIEMSYCKFEAFKVLAKNYLGIDSHPLFPKIDQLLEKTSVSPCHVAEKLIPKRDAKEAAATCLNSLILALESARLKAEQEMLALEEKKSKPESIEEVKPSTKATNRCRRCKQSLTKLIGRIF